MGASVFHGAVILSPLPAWQWKSMIILSTLGVGRIVLVRGMDAIVGQAETHQNRRNSQMLLKSVDDRYGTARTQKNRGSSKALFVSEASRAHRRMIAIN